MCSLAKCFMDLTDIYFYHHLPPTLADGDFWLVSCPSHSLVYSVWSLVLLPTDGCTPGHGRYVPHLLSSGVGRWYWLDHLRLSAELWRLLPLLLHLPSSLSSFSSPSFTPPSSSSSFNLLHVTPSSSSSFSSPSSFFFRFLVFLLVYYHLLFLLSSFVFLFSFLLSSSLF